MRKIRTVLSSPFVGMFYASIALTGFIAWIANLVAGYDGIIQYGAVDRNTGETFIDVQSPH
jgi:hypothetical protein